MFWVWGCWAALTGAFFAKPQRQAVLAVVWDVLSVFRLLLDHSTDWHSLPSSGLLWVERARRWLWTLSLAIPLPHWDTAENLLPRS